MRSFFRAVATDYDGTLTRLPRPDDIVLDAVRDVRARGVRVVLVTGRILVELRGDFPDVDRHFDAIVGENGAVLAFPDGTTRVLARPVDVSLERALDARGVPVRRGTVLLATAIGHGERVAEEIERLGLECQMIRNRGALMVLPAGVTKGSGLVDALRILGLSYHNTVSVGDAENDHSLLDCCELGVAVGDAVDALKAHADLVLGAPDGVGVLSLLRGPLLDGLPLVESRRRVVRLGTYDDGAPATIPASRVNIAIHGGSGSGKSYVAGAIAEQLVAMDYMLCVLDLEGDHLALGGMHGVVVVGGREPLPPPDQIGRVLRQGFTSVVVDLSLEREDVKRAYSLRVLDVLRRVRDEVGLPHWVMVDEAHVPMARELHGWWKDEGRQTGLCLVTYRPDLLFPIAERGEYVITLAADGAMLERRGVTSPRRFTPRARATPHVRHWHKYAEGQVSPERRFYFRDHGGLTGRSAGNVTELRRELRRADDGILRHHASHGDFSRWLADLTCDDGMVDAVRSAEAAIALGGDMAQTAAARDALVRAVTLPGTADAGVPQ